MLWAAGRRPRLLLPAALLPRLLPDQRAALLIHELAHYRRRDHWVRLLELIVGALYWWCPLAWWARRELSQAEEECCDAWVVWALPGAARAYATALVDTLDFLANTRPALPLAASGLGRVRHLQRRLTMIMRGRTRPSLTWCGALALLASAGVLLPLLPSRAQTESIQKDVETKLQKKRADQQKHWEEQRKKLIDLTEQYYDLKAKFDKQRREFERQAEELQEQIRKLEGKSSGYGVSPRFEPTGAAPRYGFGPPGTKPVPPPAAPAPGFPTPGNSHPPFGAPPGGGGKFTPVPVTEPPQAGKRPVRVVPPGTPSVVPPGTPGAGGGPNVEQRLQDLERKMDRILRLLEQKKGGRAPGPGGGIGGPAVGPGNQGGLPPAGINPGVSGPAPGGFPVQPGTPGAGLVPSGFPGGAGLPSGPGGPRGGASLPPDLPVGPGGPPGTGAVPGLPGSGPPVGPPGPGLPGGAGGPPGAGVLPGLPGGGPVGPPGAPGGAGPGSPPGFTPPAAPGQ
jgi:hypothetical protein